jgi:hypothetical protein
VNEIERTTPTRAGRRAVIRGITALGTAGGIIWPALDRDQARAAIGPADGARYASILRRWSEFFPRGVEIRTVTTTRGSGPGSLHHAIAGATPDRITIIVFAVAGAIAPDNWHDKYYYDLTGKGALWIAGQTAPGPVWIGGQWGMREETTTDHQGFVIWQHLALRRFWDEAFAPNRDIFNLYTGVGRNGANRRLLDLVLWNCSLSWWTDEAFAVAYPANVPGCGNIAIYATLFGEGFDHPENHKRLHMYPVVITHTYDHVLVGDCVFANAPRRHPRIDQGVQRAMEVNCLKYNVGGTPRAKYGWYVFDPERDDHGLLSTFDLFSSLWIAGPDSNAKPGHVFPPGESFDGGDLEGRWNGEWQVWDDGGSDVEGRYVHPASYDDGTRQLVTVRSRPLEPSPKPVVPAARLEPYLIGDGATKTGVCGARPIARDATDARILAGIRNRTSAWADVRRPTVPPDPPPPTVEGNLADMPTTDLLAIEPNGLPRIEAWLFRKHLDVGGAEDDAVARWLERYS